MQHWVNMYDRAHKPDINVTLDLAIEWERQHGTVYQTAKVQQLESTDETSKSRLEADTSYSDVAPVNKIGYVPVKSMTTDEGRRLAKQSNEVVALLKKQAYTVLDDSRSSYRSDTSRRSSSSWSQSTRSRSRDVRHAGWKQRDRRQRSGDQQKYRSREKNKVKHKKKTKFDKKRRDRKEGRVAEVREDSPEESDASQLSSQSEDEGDSQSE